MLCPFDKPEHIVLCWLRNGAPSQGGARRESACASPLDAWPEAPACHPGSPSLPETPDCVFGEVFSVDKYVLTFLKLPTGISRRLLSSKYGSAHKATWPNIEPSLLPETGFSGALRRSYFFVARQSCPDWKCSAPASRHLCSRFSCSPCRRDKSLASPRNSLSLFFRSVFRPVCLPIFQPVFQPVFQLFFRC
jgi:hypothetical protein